MANPKQAITETNAATPSVDNTDLMNRINTDAAGGLSKDQADNLVPLIYLLQPLSPQVMRGDPSRIEGAEPGDIWLRNSENPIVKSEKGMLFQPCYFYKDIVEWIPNRGGYVGRHDIDCLANSATNKPWSGTLSDVKEIVNDEKPNAPPRYIRSSNNNEVVETRYFVGYVYPETGQPLPFIIPLSSTGHSFGKQWMFLQNSQTLPDGRPIDKSWIVLYRIKTSMKTNTEGSWYMYTVQKEFDLLTLQSMATDDKRIAGRPSIAPDKAMDMYQRGAALSNAFVTGDKKADEPDETLMAGARTVSGSFDNKEGDPF